MNKINDLIQEEIRRQQETLMIIPSENYTYPEVREVVGSVLMHKYAEGQPDRRYYQGNKNVDEIEKYCESLALEVFGLNSSEWSANVQALSGSPANLAVYNSILEPGGKILSMYLPDGGHLSHGWKTADKKITLVSKIYDVDFYHVDPESKVFNYDDLEKKALEFKPKLIVSGGTAYPREIDYQRIAEIAKKVGAYYLADVAHEAGLIVGGACKSPFPYADFVTMTTHKTLRGPRGAIIICRKELEEKLDSSVFPGLQGGPHMHTIAGIAVALEKTKENEFKNYAHETVLNAKVLAKRLMENGLDVVSGGTDKHLVLIDLRNLGTNGWIVANALEIVGIIANRNTVPNETSSPFYPSGLRLGTQALTVRGMKEGEMNLIADLIDRVIKSVKDFKIPEDKEERILFAKEFKEKIEKDEVLLGISEEVKKLADKFPVPGI